MKTLQEIEDHIFSYDTSLNEGNRNNYGEVFTKTGIVYQILSFVDESLFTDPTKTCIDHGCGNGQFLALVLLLRLHSGLEFEESIKTLYGVDIVAENVNACRERLLCGREDLRHIVERNIVCADALRYHYRFDGTDPYQTEQDILFGNLFDNA